MPMRRNFLFLFVILIFCLAISSTRPDATPSVARLPTPSVTSAAAPATLQPPSPSRTPRPTTALPSPTITPPATSTGTPVPPPTLTPSASPTTAIPGTPTNFQPGLPVTVLVHPDGGLYVGDQVSFEVIVPQVDITDTSTSKVLVTGPDGNRLGNASLALYGLGQRQEAMLVWAWNTRGLRPGEYPLTFTLEPPGQTWTETVTLLSRRELPWPEPQAHWAMAHSQCCAIYYITGTAAERDMADLLSKADAQARDAVQVMGIGFTDPITITLMSRVLGHGGFASNEIDITYLDRNYAGSDFGLVLHHEMIHILDSRLGGDFRPSLFVEGLAVYKSGGHFKPEPILPRAAALLPAKTGLGWYIPLAELADNFYMSQHEIGYLEGAALIQYMVNTWGWDAFSSFYRDIHTAEDHSQASAIDAALQKHFQITFAELEANFTGALAQIPITAEQRDDLRLTVEYFNAVRRYQQILDPSAYFATAWLVDTGTMRSRGIVADYLRHPSGAGNLALETMLSYAFSNLELGQYARVEPMINAVNDVLDAVQGDDNLPFAVNALASDFYAIVLAASQAGYEVQRIELDAYSAKAWVTAGSAELIELALERSSAGWEILGISTRFNAAAWVVPDDWFVPLR
jgi:hypothetical protein